MKKFLLLVAFAAAAVLAPSAAGAADVVPISTATWCNVAVSTSVATRLDNFNATAGCDGVMPYRTEFKFCVPPGGTAINFGYDSTVSTKTVTQASGEAASVRAGETVAAGSCVDLSIKNQTQVWALSQAASAAQQVQSTQASTTTTP